MRATATAAAASADVAVMEADVGAGRVAGRATAKFRAKQSCFHYCATWMPGCTPDSRPDQIHRHMGRPACFSSDITGPAEWDERVNYGGTVGSVYTYLVH